MKILNWVKGIFDANSSVSSKRFIGVTVVFWAMFMGSYYIIKLQYGGKESSTTVSLLEFAIVSGVSLLAGGTLAEKLGNNKKTSKDEIN